MIVLGICVGFLSAALAGLLFSFLTTTLRANQNVAGLAITIFGAGLAKFMRTLISAETAAKATVANTIFAKSLPFAGSLGWFGSIVFKHGFMFYLAIAIAILLHIVFKKTRTGLNLRAVGEGPATADAAGVDNLRVGKLYVHRRQGHIGDDCVGGVLECAFPCLIANHGV